MKIAQRILAQARRDVEALELASARLHNPPTLLSLVTAPRSAYDLGERFVTVAPAEPLPASRCHLRGVQRRSRAAAARRVGS